MIGNLEKLKSNILKKCYLGLNKGNIIFEDDFVKYVSEKGTILPLFKEYNSKIKSIENLCEITVDLFLECLDLLFINNMDIKDITLRLPNGYNYGKSIQLIKFILGNDYDNFIKTYKKLNKFTSLKCSGEIVDSERDRLGVCYVWKMKIEYKGKQYTFKFTNSINNGNATPTTKDCMYGLICDRQAFLSCVNLDDFYQNYCSNDMTAGEVYNIYNACEKTSLSLERVFGEDLKWFENFLNDY